MARPLIQMALDSLEFCRGLYTAYDLAKSMLKQPPSQA